VKQQGWMLEFSISLPNIIRNQWYELAHILNHVVLEEKNDIALLNWTTSRKLSVKSVYKQLTKHEFGPSFKRIWKAKLTEKIKVFMWLVQQNAILTKDNLLRKKW
jgi:hypothetical protein